MSCRGATRAGRRLLAVKRKLIGHVDKLQDEQALGRGNGLLEDKGVPAEIGVAAGLDHLGRVLQTPQGRIENKRPKTAWRTSGSRRPWLMGRAPPAIASAALQSDFTS